MSGQKRKFQASHVVSLEIHVLVQCDAAKSSYLVIIFHGVFSRLQLLNKGGYINAVSTYVFCQFQGSFSLKIASQENHCIWHVYVGNLNQL